MSEVKALTGNKCAAYGAALCRPDLIAAYPITPQSSVVETLADMVYSGELDSRMVQVESEHSAMSVVQGAAAAGGRVFTATSAQGLALMYEPYFRMSTLRLPMVMAIATREMTSPETIWSGQQDAMSVREAGWIQCFCETNQEILDMILQGYMLAEDPRVLIPVNVCYDGFYSSHLVERVELPSQADADAFLPPYSLPAKLDPRTPQALDPMTPGELLMKYRRDHLESMKAALAVIDEVDAKFAAAFGRSYGGCIDTYRMEDADFALVTVGGMTGTARDAVDEARERGIAVVASLHEVDLAQKAADHVICIKDGHVMCQGSPDEVFTAERIADLYDLAPGAYDPAFGSVELARPEGEPEVFVIAGGSTGATCFRRLAREGVPFATGVLHEHDTDGLLARSLATLAIFERDFEPVSAESVTRAREVLLACREVICCVSGFGTANARNAELLDAARAAGISVRHEGSRAN